MTNLLEVRNLRVTFPSARGPVEVVKGISFSLGRERLGIVGESGSGKSMTGRSILKLIRSPGKVTADRLDFDGLDLLRQNDKQMRAIRGARISMIMQDPKFSLNPVMTIGAQIAEALLTHQRLGRGDIRQRVHAMLESVRIADPARVAKLYPHEVSGGMGQRVMIAMLLAPNPDLLIADEPTSALDASVQAEILKLIEDLVSARGMGLMLISHDLPLVSRFCDRVVVMYAGQVMEELPARDLHRARHAYTRGLLECMPSLSHKRARLPTLNRDPAWLEPRA